MEVSINKGVSNQAISGWTFDPTAGNIASYTFEYTIEERSGGTVPSWITINGSNEIEIDDSSMDPSTDVGVHEFQIRGTVQDESANSLTDRYAIEPFDLTVYTLIASTTASQYHKISGGSDTYAISAFSGWSDTSYAATYSLLSDDGLRSDATSTYSSWLGLSGTTITINSVTDSEAG